MVNLVTAIIAIVLVLVTGVAGFYYGGDAFATSTHETDYAKIVNGAEQISTAMELYKIDYGVYPNGVADLGEGVLATDELLQRLMDEGYLSGVPDGTWTIDGGIIQRNLDDAQQCINVNRVGGYVSETCPACNDAAYSLWPACEST